MIPSDNDHVIKNLKEFYKVNNVRYMI
jgi:hypothetical protein